MKFVNINYLHGLFKKIFRRDIFFRFLRFSKYKILGIPYILNSLKNKQNIFLIYTMGKVASASIYESLKRILPFSKIYHVHFLTKENILWRQQFKNNPSATIVEKHVLKQLNNNKNKRLKIITLVRDIINRDISMMFQNLSSFIDYQKPFREKHIDQLLEKFEDLDHSMSIQWFEKEFERYLGLDIYSLKFNKEKGYSIYQLDNFDLLIIKLENLNSIYKEALEKYINIEFDLLIKINEAKNKNISNLYKIFRNNLNINAKKLEYIYNSKFMKHFYTDIERNELKNKWLNK